MKKSKMNCLKPSNNYRLLCLHTLWSMKGYTPLKPTTQVVIIIKLESIVKRRIMKSFQVQFVLNLFRTFELIIELYDYKHNSLLMFINLIKTNVSIGNKL